MELITAEQIATALHDAEIDLETVKRTERGVEFSGLLYDLFRKNNGRPRSAKFAFEAVISGATDVVVEDLESVGILSVCDVEYDEETSTLVLSGCIPGAISIVVPSSVLTLNQSSKPLAVRSLFRWRPTQAGEF